MGLLRVIYAVAVIFVHTFPFLGFLLLSRNLAVWSFFVISGFYMGLILNEKYIGKNGSNILFITNRFLRIYPVYLATLFSTIVICLLFELFKLPNPLHNYFFIQRSPFDWVGDVLRNLTLIIAPDYLYQSKNLPGFFLLPQAWTLQLELLFYLFAPFLFRRKWYVVTLFLLAILSFDYAFVFPRHWFYAQPLTYRFFENIPFFLLGGISYSIYRKVQKLSLNKKMLYGIFFLFVAFTVFYNYIHLPIPFISSHHHTDWIYYILLLALIPFVFTLTKKNKLDRLIGELSYPIYIIHFFTIILVTGLFTNITHAAVYPLLVVLLSIVFAAFLAFFVDRKVDIWRQERLELRGEKRAQFSGLFPKIRLSFVKKFTNGYTR